MICYVEDQLKNDTLIKENEKDFFQKWQEV